MAQDPHAPRPRPENRLHTAILPAALLATPGWLLANRRGVGVAVPMGSGRARRRGRRAPV